ncbi:MAG: phosphatidylserine/phosphatidylglycerophosphate/cardiolipin synthase family protein [Hyphomicrobiales bacterium]|nr:phosphatidylserine/phosphatidylglycerophosphate/cardiolipin synthase family protein [Hyphomicrobiales bacterium]
MFRFLVFIVGFSVLSISAEAGSCQSDLFSSIARTTAELNYPEMAVGSVNHKNSVNNKVLMGVNEIFSKAGQLMQDAQSNIYVQTWNFDRNSTLAKSFALDLVKLSQRRRRRGAKNPVHVWVMINIIGFQVAEFEKKATEKFFNEHHLNNEFTQIHVGIFVSRFLGANHAKTISIDDKVAVVTGANLSQKASNPNQFDLGLVVRGQIVHEINRDFARVWHRYIDNNQAAPELEKQRLSARVARNCLPIMFTRSEVYSYLSSTIQHSSINQALLNSVREAKTSIDIMTPNLNVKIFRKVIKEAVEANVKIRVILSKGYLAFLQNLPSRGGDNSINVARLYHSLSGTLPKETYCNRLQIRWYSKENLKTMKRWNAPANHAKFMVVDGRVSYFGSANMDNQSWVNSREIGLFIDNRQRAQNWLKQVFEPAFSKATIVKACRGSATVSQTTLGDR